MPASIRITDPVSCGDSMGGGSPDTFAEILAMSRERIDFTNGHCYIPTTIQALKASPDVFINSPGPVGIPGPGEEKRQYAADRVGDPIIPHNCPDVGTHGGYMSVGASHVFINSGSGAGAIIDNNPSFVSLSFGEKQIPDNVNPAPASDITSADVYIYENNDIPTEPAPLPPGTTQFQMEEITDDQTPPPTDVPPVQDCSDVDALPADFTWSDTFGTFADFAASFALSPNFTVANVCYCAVSNYSFSSAVTQNSELTQKQILANMCHHAKTVLEPILSAYGSFTITSGFRNNSGSSQHNKGQATDLQFLDIHGLSDTGDQYFALAQNIRDNINYDQMILEWFGRNPWIHISSTPSGHRHSVLTQVSSSSYASGLKLLRKSYA